MDIFIIEDDKALSREISGTLNIALKSTPEIKLINTGDSI